VFNWLFARRFKGRFLLRIEDTDAERSRPEYTENILQGLQWLGLGWDEPPLLQSTRLDAHVAAIQDLLHQGRAYRCYVSEEELSSMREAQRREGNPPRYDNRHRDLSRAQEEAYITEGRQAVIRFRIDDDVRVGWQDMVRGPMEWRGADLGGDIILARRAPAGRIGDPLYNLVVVVDDDFMQISHVIRGEDHLANTAKQLLLYEALGLRVPLFAHTPLILNRDGRKLSKRDGVTSVSDFHAMGYTSAALANYITLLGWSPPESMGERFSLEEAAQAFSLDRVNRAGARFDWDKLRWLNAQVLHDLTPETLHEKLGPIWRERGWSRGSGWCVALCALLGPSLTLLTDGVEQARPFFERPEADSGALAQLEVPGAREALSSLLHQLQEQPWYGEDLQHAKRSIDQAASTAGVKKGLVIKTLRAALLGSLQGPDLLATWGLLAQVNEDIPRLEHSLRQVTPPQQ